ncbi:zinc-dependent alcohol dehydrogenase family protein [Gracilibacillus alcaliphilus]|uniref:zinc-dependent alcohol dehydrogenase family protein n=1 Tax=Gracilibacillus alcaliphilus TaxID=1401441 RepID=UPI00195DBF10|nr:zinc-dependent alcohol dehydrogenase family protein [Gracilibacillus alcaliphilus]MBM7676381.1 2-desacetyl-2-hydroxyethyl bacteriochlorophyllide A dehydrogenase [Gracilibacillus alcaliphilus]
MNKVALLEGLEQISIQEQPRPDFQENEVLIRVKNCGICGTDIHIYHGHPGSAEVTPPRVLGHELAGEVVAVGSEVTELLVGDRVSVDPNIYCQSCEFCRKGQPNLCDNLQAIGVTRDGGMAEYCAVPAANSYKIPNAMTYEQAAMVEPLGCVLHGFKKLTIRSIDEVLIIGGGFIGQLFLQLVGHTHPKKITVIEPMEHKHTMLKQLGASDVWTPAQLDKQLTADIVIECVGRQDSAATAVAQARKGGQVLLFGVASPETMVEISPFEVFTKELRLYGSFINPHTHEEAIALIANGQVKVDELISHRLSITELPDVMKNYPALNISKAVICLH